MSDDDTPKKAISLTPDELERLIEERSDEKAEQRAEQILQEKAEREAHQELLDTVERLDLESDEFRTRAERMQTELEAIALGFGQVSLALQELEEGQLTKKARRVVAQWSAGGGVSLVAIWEIVRSFIT